MRDYFRNCQLDFIGKEGMKQLVFRGVASFRVLFLTFSNSAPFRDASLNEKDVSYRRSNKFPTGNYSPAAAKP